jgi:hypothetical protein
MQSLEEPQLIEEDMTRDPLFLLNIELSYD